jgi:hypothetical protein
MVLVLGSLFMNRNDLKCLDTQLKVRNCDDTAVVCPVMRQASG